MGCSGGSSDGNPAIPDDGQGIQKSAAGKSNLAVLGFYTVCIDKAAGTIEAVPHREAQDVLNVLGFLEPPPYENLTIDFDTLEFDPVENYVGVDVILTHPLNKSFFTGFEVRGVVFGPEVTNADGATRWMNPTEFSGMPYGYQDGALGAPDYYANYENLYNGYKLFCDAYPSPMYEGDWDGGDVEIWDTFDPLDTYFSAGESKSAHYDLDFGVDPGDFMIFNYAIIANYAFPGGSGPWSPEDFPLNAHCPEPFLIGVELYENESYWDPPYGAGGTILMGVRVYDWTNPEANDVMISAPELGIPMALPTEYVPGDDGISGVYLFDLDVLNGDGVGYYPLTITVTDPMTYGGAYFLGAMPATHDLYGEPISVTIDSPVYLRDVDIFIDHGQAGYLTYDIPSGEGAGHAGYGFMVEWAGIEVSSVMLETGVLGDGVEYAFERKGEGGFIFHLNNDVGMEPGEYAMNYNVHFMNGHDVTGVAFAAVIDKAAEPDPIFTHSVTYGDYGNIGDIDLYAVTDAVCGINYDKKFKPKKDTDCDEYRWIQVISTNDPVTAGAPGSYVDPYGNDGTPAESGDPYYWNDAEAASENTAADGKPGNPKFWDKPRRPTHLIPCKLKYAWWHAELALVCVRNGKPDKVLRSEHIYFFKDKKTGKVDSGSYDGKDGGSKHFRETLKKDFPDYEFE